MYKLLIVDDEEIEREGIAQLIPWGRYDIQVTGTAWNGQDALAQMAVEQPDIVLTDIKMPIMDGLELIRRCRYEYPDVVFVVLSGHGEFECTSQAMAEGVRYYILKPCGEEEIMAILEQVKAGIRTHNQEKAREKQYHYHLSQTLPRAKEQLFRNLLLGYEQPEPDLSFFDRELFNSSALFCVVAIRKETPFDYMQQQLVYGSLCKVYQSDWFPMVAAIRQDVLLLANPIVVDELEQVLRFLRREWSSEGLEYLHAAVSDPHQLNAIHTAYEELLDLFRFGSELRSDILLCRQIFRDTGGARHLVNMRKLAGAKEIGEVFYLAWSTFQKMELDHLSYQEKVHVSRWILQILYGESLSFSYASDSEDLWELFIWLINELLKHAQGSSRDLDEDRWMYKILTAIYRNIQNPAFNLRYLSREVLFMNEDYLGKVFARKMKIKFSDYLLQLRIRLAKELLEYRPSLRISQLATQVGYAPDGQYFSKAFRKVTGMSPKEYQSYIKENIQNL